METTYEVAMDQIKLTVNMFVKRSPYLLNYYQTQDLNQAILCHFEEKGLIQQYNPKIASFRYFIGKVAKNYLIDLTRKRRLNCVSLNKKVRHEYQERELGELIEDKQTSSPEEATIFMDLVEKVPEKEISPFYSLTWKKLFEYLVEGYSPKEISEKILVHKGSSKARNLSAGRVGYLILELKGMCKRLLEVG